MRSAGLISALALVAGGVFLWFEASRLAGLVVGLIGLIAVGAWWVWIRGDKDSAVHALVTGIAEVFKGLP